MDFKIEKGYDLPIHGAADKSIADYQVETVALAPLEFRFFKGKAQIKEGDKVKKGENLLQSKASEKVFLASPVSGVVEEIRLGRRRVMERLVIRPEGDESVQHEKIDESGVESKSAEEMKTAICERGLWPMIRQRPYNKMPDPDTTPSSIFVKALESGPLAGDPNYILAERGEDFKLGIAALKKICEKVFVCLEGNEQPASSLTGTKGEEHRFSGPHPRGNVSVHIEKLDPIYEGGKIVWYITAANVAAMGKTLKTGVYDSERVFAWVGPAAAERKYYRTTLGAKLSSLPVDKDAGEVRLITGDVLTGRGMSRDDAYLGFYDNTVSALAEDTKREFFGWMKPGFKSHSMTPVFASNVIKPKEYKFTTSTNGSHRPLVDGELYEKVQPLMVMTDFLYKALVAENIDEAERHGLWGVEVEDFALAAYMCPSKTDFAEPFNKVMAYLNKEEG